jgi:hypothetical protein
MIHVSQEFGQANIQPVERGRETEAAGDSHCRKKGRLENQLLERARWLWATT